MGGPGRQKVCAIVPMKGFGGAKSRLSTVLNDGQRRSLAWAMFLDVLTVLGHAQGIASIMVVTSDPEVGAAAQAVGALVVADEIGSGTDEAVRQGVYAAAEAGWPAVLVVPADIPFLCVAEIEAARAAMRSHAVVITPAARDGGTNLLGLTPPLAIRTQFGPDSFSRHVQAARAADIEPEALVLAGAGRDIDEPSDLWLDAGDGPAIHTRRLLEQLRFFDRPESTSTIRKTGSP